jgi:hypothetical protein
MGAVGLDIGPIGRFCLMISVATGDAKSKITSAQSLAKMAHKAPTFIPQRLCQWLAVIADTKSARDWLRPSNHLEMKRDLLACPDRFFCRILYVVACCQSHPHAACPGYFRFSKQAQLSIWLAQGFR